MARRIIVSRHLAVMGCVLACSLESPGVALSREYSSPISSHAASVSTGFMCLATSMYFFTNVRFSRRSEEDVLGFRS